MIATNVETFRYKLDWWIMNRQISFVEVSDNNFCGLPLAAESCNWGMCSDNISLLVNPRALRERPHEIVHVFVGDFVWLPLLAKMRAFAVIRDNSLSWNKWSRYSSLVRSISTQNSPGPEDRFANTTALMSSALVVWSHPTAAPTGFEPSLLESTHKRMVGLFINLSFSMCLPIAM